MSEKRYVVNIVAHIQVNVTDTEGCDPRTIGEEVLVGWEREDFYVYGAEVLNVIEEREHDDGIETTFATYDVRCKTVGIPKRPCRL